MIRTDALLLTACVLFALGAVTSQHQARKAFYALEQAQEHARELEVEYGQLQLELSTWATSPRVEKIARDTLKMHVPSAAKIILATPKKESR